MIRFDVVDNVAVDVGLVSDRIDGFERDDRVFGNGHAVRVGSPGAVLAELVVRRGDGDIVRERCRHRDAAARRSRGRTRNAADLRRGQVDVGDRVGRDVGGGSLRVEPAEIHRAVLREPDAARVGRPVLPVERILLRRGVAAERGGDGHGLSGRRRDVRRSGRLRGLRHDDVVDDVTVDIGFVAGPVDGLEINGRVFGDGHAVRISPPCAVVAELVVRRGHGDIVRERRRHGDAPRRGARGRTRDPADLRRGRIDGGGGADRDGEAAAGEIQRIRLAVDRDRFADVELAEVRAGVFVPHGDRIGKFGCAFRELVSAVRQIPADRERKIAAVVGSSSTAAPRKG